MSDQRLTELPAVSTAGGSDLLYLVASGVSKRILVNAFTTSILASVGITISGGSLVFKNGFGIGGNGEPVLPVLTAPTSSGSVGVKGTVVWDANHVYVCVDTNTWKRADLNSW